MARIAVFAVLLLAAAGPACAESAWIAAPTLAEMTAAYPAKAAAEGIGGAVDVVCTTARSGAMTDCEVLGETPRGYGFGPAARTLARKLRPTGVLSGTEHRATISFPAGLGKGPVTVKTPKWTALPSLAEMQAAAPKGEGGPNDVRVTLVCDVQAGGTLSGCAVDREEPAGQGFGPAILSLAGKFQVDLMSGEGTPTVGAKVRVPVRFALTPAK